MNETTRHEAHQTTCEIAMLLQGLATAMNVFWNAFDQNLQETGKPNYKLVYTKEYKALSNEREYYASFFDYLNFITENY